MSINRMTKITATLSHDDLRTPGPVPALGSLTDPGNTHVKEAWRVQAQLRPPVDKVDILCGWNLKNYVNRYKQLLQKEPVSNSLNTNYISHRNL